MLKIVRALRMSRVWYVRRGIILYWDSLVFVYFNIDRMGRRGEGSDIVHPDISGFIVAQIEILLFVCARRRRWGGGMFEALKSQVTGDITAALQI